MDLSILVVLIVVFALVFDLTNGWNDASSRVGKSGVKPPHSKEQSTLAHGSSISGSSVRANLAASAAVMVNPGAMGRVARSARIQRPHST